MNGCRLKPFEKIWLLKKWLLGVLLLLLNTLACQESTGSNTTSLEVRQVEQAVNLGEKLFSQSAVGNNEGMYPAAAFERCRAILQNNRKWLKHKHSITKAQADSVADVIYNALMEFEASVHSQLTELIDLNATKQTRYLYHSLKRLAGHKMLFGMHDALGYGVGWQNMDTRSDVKDVCGDYPALFSWDAYYFFQTADDEQKHYQQRMTYAHNLGGVTSLCWHQFDPQEKGFYQKDMDYQVVPTLLPGGRYHKQYRRKLEKLARFAKRLRGENGESIPIIFRPYHEQNGNWFWWGKPYRTRDEFVRLWRFTVQFLKDTLGVHNFIYAFSPDGNQFETKKGYLTDYPGDDVVDVLALDFYFGKGDQEEIKRFLERVVWTVELAQSKGKIAALSEVGDYLGFKGQEAHLKIPQWYTRCFLAPLKNHALAKRIVYGAVWRNASETHHFAPYPGHPAVPDFLDFYQDDFTLFLNDLPPMFTYQP